MGFDRPSFLTLLGYLSVALVLSTLIGLEREYRQKSAGMRTNALVGLGAALFMVISKYAFFDVLQHGVVLDPSRVAAQIVTGIGFIGGGLIFVHRNSVQGLTTAAGVWLTAAVGAAAGAGLLAIAAVVTAAYYLVAFAYPAVVRLLRRPRPIPWLLHLQYLDGRGALRAAVREIGRHGFEIGELNVAREEPVYERSVEATREGDTTHRSNRISVDIEIVGKGSSPMLVDALDEIDGVLAVHIEDEREEAN